MNAPVEAELAEAAAPEVAQAVAHKVKHIALVGPLPPPSGGMANQALQLAKLLRSEGIEVSFVQVNAPYRPAWVGGVKGLRAIFRIVPYIASLWRAAGSTQLLHVMANSGWSWHLFAAPAIWIGRLRGTPVVINYRGGEADNFFRRSLKWVRPSMLRATAVIVPSGFLAHVFGKYGFPMQVVPNIVDLSRFSAAPGGSREEGPRLLVTRNLEPIYDNATALRALALVKQQKPGATLVIAGSGELRDALLKLTAELGLQDSVTFTGRVDTADMPALYQSADIMLNPSLVDNTPNSVLEALASGVAVVSTNVGGVPYLVENEKTALLVEPAQPEAMAAAILRLCDDAALSQRLRSMGRSYVQQFTWSGVRPRLLDVYHQVLGERS